MLDAFDDPVDMVGMVDLAPAPAHHFLGRRAGIFVPALVVPVDPAVLVGHPGELGQRIGHRAQVALGTLGIVDVSADADALLHLARRVADRGDAHLEPAPRAVRAPDAALDFVRLSGLGALAPGREGTVAAVVREHLTPTVAGQCLGGQAGVDAILLVHIGVAAFAVALEDQPGNRVGDFLEPRPPGLGLGRTLAFANLARHVLDLVDDEGHLAVRPQHGDVARLPPALLECTSGAADVVFLKRHHVGPPGRHHALERCGEVGDAGRLGIVGIVGKDVEQLAADHILQPGVGHLSRALLAATIT